MCCVRRQVCATTDCVVRVIPAAHTLTPEMCEEMTRSVERSVDELGLEKRRGLCFIMPFAYGKLAGPALQNSGDWLKSRVWQERLGFEGTGMHPAIADIQRRGGAAAEP